MLFSREHNVCRKLSEKGYMIVLDDFIFHSDMKLLVLLADIIKIDFRNESFHNIEMGVNKLRQ